MQRDTTGVHLDRAAITHVPTQGHILVTNFIFRNSVARDRNSIGGTLSILALLSLLVTLHNDRAKSKLFMDLMMQKLTNLDLGSSKKNVCLKVIY